MLIYFIEIGSLINFLIDVIYASASYNHDV